MGSALRGEKKVLSLPLPQLTGGGGRASGHELLTFPPEAAELTEVRSRGPHADLVQILHPSFTVRIRISFPCLGFPT